MAVRISGQAVACFGVALLCALLLGNFAAFGPADTRSTVVTRRPRRFQAAGVGHGLDDDATDVPSSTSPSTAAGDADEKEDVALGAGAFDAAAVLSGAAVGGAVAGAASGSDCGYISFLLCRYIDIDFIEFVLSSHPKPTAAKVVDIGVYQGGELVHMAKMGFNVEAFEPNPARFEKSNEEVKALPEVVRNRIKLHQNAVADRTSKLYFQRAGLDSHIYFPEDPTKLKPHTITVDAIPISGIVNEDKYFVKIDTQGFDTRIVETLLDSLATTKHVVNFIQFEFSPFFEVSRAQRSKADHKRVFRKLLDAGYDVYQGAAVQPWLRSHRGTYGKSPLAMLAPAATVPTCVDEFVEFMHSGKERALYPGKTSTEIGLWMDVLAVRRVARTPYYRHTGWVLARKM